MIARLLATALAIAPAAAQTPGDALIERYVAVLPDQLSDVLPAELTPEEQGELKQLKDANPGKDLAVTPIFTDYRQCKLTAGHAITMKMVRDTARRLSAADIEKLIAFYQGPDYAKFDKLTQLPNPTAEEQGQIDALMRAYPMQAYVDASKAEQAALFDDPSPLDALRKCDSARDAALERAGLKD